MKRLRLIFVFAFCGMLMTIAVCCLVAYFAPAERIPMQPSTLILVDRPSLGRLGWLRRSHMAAHLESKSSARRVESWGSDGQARIIDDRSSMPNWSAVAVLESMPDDFDRWDLEYAFGWPWLAMSSHWSYQEINWGSRLGPYGPNYSIVQGIELPDGGMTPVRDRVSARTANIRIPMRLALPTRILPLGFALNAAFNGVVAFSLFKYSRFALCRWRRKAGTCVKCRYDLRGGGHEKCPECGMAIGSLD